MLPYKTESCVLKSPKRWKAQSRHLPAKRIIDEAITPRFKQGDYVGDLDVGVTRIMALVTGEALLAPAKAVSTPSGGFDWMQLGIFTFIAIPVVSAVRV